MKQYISRLVNQEKKIILPLTEKGSFSPISLIPVAIIAAFVVLGAMVAVSIVNNLAPLPESEIQTVIETNTTSEEKDDSSSNLSLDDYGSPSAKLTPAETALTQEEEITQSLSQQYKNQKFHYSVFYSPNWSFRVTFGDTVVQVEDTDILDGFDLHLYQESSASTEEQDKKVLANVGFNILSSKGFENINDFIKAHSLEEPHGLRTRTEYSGVRANKYLYTQVDGSKNRALFFIKGDYLIKIWWWGTDDDNLALAEEVVNNIQID